MLNKSQYNQEYAKEQVDSKALDRELVWRLLGYLRPYKAWLCLALLLLFCSRVIEATLPAFIGYISQTVLNSVDLDAAQKSVVLHGVLRECFLILGLFFLSYILETTNIALKSWVGQKSLYHLRMQVYEHIVRMPLAYYDQHSIGRLMTRTIHDIDQINLMFAESVVPILGSIMLFVCMFICIFVINWKIAILVMLILPLVWAFTHHFQSVQRRCYDRVRTVVSAMNTFVQEHLMGASTIRNFGLQSQAQLQFEAINEDHCNANAESVFNFGFFIAGIDFLQSLSLILAFVIIVLSASNQGSFQAGTYITFSLYVIMFFRPLADLAERYNMLQSAIAAASRIFDVLDTPSEHANDHGKSELGIIESISFENVWFAYEKENWVLKGVSFKQQMGESVAVVGLTGEGKSTIMSLLLRFYEIQQGAIKINGADIRSYTLASLRSQFSVVLQDPVIFSGTIADNIAIFDPNISSSAVNDVIRYLGMEVNINRFSNGVEHVLNEQGKGLSAGEKQLISLARAVAHQRSALILDEATANIDTSTELVIQEALKKILVNVTAIVIAHRLSTIKDVSRILVLESGRIVEEGSHEALIARKGVYEKLYRLQFAKGM